MMNRLTHLLSSGLQQVWLNTHYLLVVFLLVVLPALFIWVVYSSFDAAYQNVNTAEKQSISALHDSVELLLNENVSDNVLQKYLLQFTAEDKSITKARILHQDAKDLIITHSTDSSDIGLVEGATESYKASASVPGDSLIFDFTINDTRTWQAFRQIYVWDEIYYVFTEHSFAEIDAVMSVRQQQSYLVLPVVFLFLMFLAYWLVRQTQWQKEYASTRKKLDEQMLFTNTIAHELRAPLTAIRGYVSFFKESENLSADEKKYAENINVSSERLLALINDFLEVARIQSGNLKIKFNDVDVRKVLDSVKEEFAQVAESKGLKFDVDVPNKPVIAETDADRLQQVLTNLVSNALKYTEEGSVTLALQQTKLKTVITIKDTGHGIAAEDQQKLFQAFTRVGKADNSGVTGTGLGMWITKQLIVLLHGEIAVESIEGIGTHVKLTFDV